MATVTIKELYDILTVNNISDYDISAKDLSGITQTIIDSENTVNYILRKYGTRRYSILKGREVNDTEAEIDFHEAFKLWLINRQHNINKQYQALFNYDYSPIENVDRYETETINADGTKTYGKRSTHSGTDTETHSGTDSTANTGNDTATHKITGDSTVTQKAGFNAPNTFTNDEKTDRNLTNEENKTTYNSTVNLNHGESISNQYGEIITDSGTDTTSDDTVRELRIHGNIGVTTNTQLINDEIELRLISLAEMLIDNFINDYTFYS